VTSSNYLEMISLVTLLLLLIILLYIMLNHRESAKILENYGEIIKRTMDLEEVKQFISLHKRIMVQVEEGNGMVRVYWVTNTRYPYIVVFFDKSQGRIRNVVHVRVREDEVKLGINSKQGDL